MKVSELAASSPATIDALQVAVNQPRWTPASLNDGSTWIFDPDDLTTFTMSAADSILCTAISNLFGGGITGTISVGHVLPANPYFGGRNTLALRGGTSRVSMNLLDKFKNVPAITLCSLIRLPTLTVTATPPPEQPVYMYVGTAADASVRAQIAGDVTVPNAYRRGGRRLDADTGNNLSFTGNVGTQTALVYVEYDYANKTVTSWMDEVQKNQDTNFQTVGNTENANSFWVGLGSFNDARSAQPAIEYGFVMFRAGKLTTLERQKLAGYLMHRSRLESKLPSAHPYRYVTP